MFLRSILFSLLNGVFVRPIRISQNERENTQNQRRLDIRRFWVTMKNNHTNSWTIYGFIQDGHGNISSKNSTLKVV